MGEDSIRQKRLKGGDFLPQAAKKEVMCRGEGLGKMLEVCSCLIRLQLRFYKKCPLEGETKNRLLTLSWHIFYKTNQDILRVRTPARQ